MFLKRRSIALKLSLLILTASSLILLAILGYNYRVSRDIIRSRVEENARNLARATIYRIQKVLVSVEKIPENLALVLENTSYTEKDLKKIIRSVVEKNREVFGSAVAFEPRAFSKEKKLFSPYFYKSEGRVKYADLGNDDYNYIYWDWYRVPKDLGHPVWSEPYFDEGGGNIIMTTYSAPFYKNVNGKRRFMGVVTADISLAWLQEIVSSVRIFRSGYGFLVSGNGTFVTHPNSDFIMNESIFSLADQRKDPGLKKIGMAMIGGKIGFVPIDDLVSKKKSWIIYMPLPSLGWSLGVVYPQKELLADIRRLNRVLIALSATGFSLLLAIIVFIAGTFTRPLRALASAAADIARGELDIEIPPAKSRDEVGELTEAFDHMRSSIKKYIQNLTDTTAAKERIESELNIAREIQMGLLPSTFPPFPSHKEFDLFATIQPARQVGGDLYDFFLIDNDHLCFIIGDVSDKGIPAAFFMAVTKTLMKVTARRGLGPEEILARVNRELCRENESCMFVTLFCGILNITTGEVIYSDGGHNPPALIRRDMRVSYLRGSKGTAVGAFDGAVYTADRFDMRTGDTLFLYTDGVTESLNKEGEGFSEERLLTELSILGSLPLKGLVMSVLREVEKFADEEPQADDIAILALRFYETGLVDKGIESGFFLEES